MEELSLHGLAAVLPKVPRILARIYQVAGAVGLADPDVLVLIDAPDFNLRVGRRVRRRHPAVAIVDYVPPTVWAYRSGRARAMARFIDHALAVLPFEPAAHRSLGGPPCTYVGHPLIEVIGQLRPADGERAALAAASRPVLLVLPGSRRSEIARLMQPFGETLALVIDRLGPLDVVVPAVAHLASEIEARAATWPVAPRIVVGDAAKFAAFRSAHAALAASGTVTLELALSGVPMVVAYRVDPLIRPLKRLYRPKSFAMPNLIIDDQAIPEFLDGQGKPERLADALMPLLADTPVRARQLAALARVGQAMAVAGGSPSRRAAEIVVETARARRLRAAAGKRGQ
jgi:lipid-A-disaccharide synthase